MIEVKNLVKRYGNHTAVDDLSFTVGKGQILGFLGPNGAGKSTTMNIITGYISATEGTVIVNGLDVFEEPEEVKKMIGYLPEFPPLYPDLTVLEYLDFVADIKKVKRSAKRQMVDDIMEATKISDVKNRLIRHLSKGYKQRVGLAQAIMGYPELIILDEPTVGLDPKQIKEIRELIRELSKEHTIILSSHIMQEVNAVCDSILIIDKGRLILQDKPENLGKHFSSTVGVKLVVKGDKDTIISELRKIDSITKLEETRALEEGTVGLTVYSNEDKDIREDLFFSLSGIRTPILEMQSISMSLEDIFLKVTQEEESVNETSTSSEEEVITDVSDL
ncbi:MAG: ABC transporter ATP-binding protein [Clostridiales bacterium]|nr:ABC transporter ATP-binding protein [Bacillota bacterium]NLK03018.1 ABC transporter ATP-binding protein [Clostridiales bacterium]